MNIIAVIVDEVPLCTSRCRFGKAEFDKVYRSHYVECPLLLNQYGATIRELTTKRCHDCPLMTAEQYAERCDSSLPKLSDFKGIYKDDGVPSEYFVRKLRDEWGAQ